MREHDDNGQDWPSRHPSENTLAAYLDDDLAADERSEIEAHLEVCNACRLALADTVGVLEADAKRAISPDSSNSPTIERRLAARRPRRRVAVLLVTGALAASITGVVILRPATRYSGDISPPTRDERFGASDERIRELAAIAPPNDAGVTDRPNFIWARDERAARYSFHLLGEDGATIWSRDVADTTLALPASVTLDAGRSYYWRVDAMSAGIVASTRARRFTIGP